MEILIKLAQEIKEHTNKASECSFLKAGPQIKLAAQKQVIFNGLIIDEIKTLRCENGE
jgi:hypothetical protein